MIGRCAPEFRELTTKRKGYWFRSDSQRPCYQFIVIGSSQKERCLTCDVSWGFFPIWDGALGTHQMTAAAGLPNLRLRSRAIPAEESYYEHEGTEAGIRRTLDRIGLEIVTHAFPWFRSKTQEAHGDRLLQHGLEWLRAHDQSIPASIQEDLRQAFVQAGHVPWRVELPVFDLLKTELRDFAAKIGASSDHRKETAILAQHLLIYSGNTKQNVA